MGDFTTQAAKLEHDENQYREATIEEAVAQMVKASGDNQNTVINTLAKILQNNNFRLIYNECIEMIPNQKSVHVECRLLELGVREFLLQVAEKGWDNVYIVHKKVHIQLVTHTRDPKGKILLPREKFIKKDPKTGKVKIKYSKAVRENKVAVKEYTGEPILFKKSKARRNEFVNFLNENNISDPWAFKEQSDKQNNTTPKAKANDIFQKFLDMGDLRWGEVEITISDKSIIIISARGKTARVTSGEFGLLDRNKGTPNEIYLLFVSFANNQTVGKDRKMTVSRARELLKSKLGINKTPIELKGKLYKPNFKISMGDYKNNKGEGKTTSLENGGFKDAVPNPQGRDPQDELENYEIGSGTNFDTEEDDKAGEWLKNNPSNQE